MAIIGKSIDEIKGLLGNANDLQILIGLLQDKKNPLSDRITELEGIDDLLAQKTKIMKALADIEKNAVKNASDVSEIEVQKQEIAKLLEGLKTAQMAHDEREVMIKAQEKVTAKQKKDVEKALTNAEAAETAIMDKSAKLDSLIAENETLKGRLETQVATYKNRLTDLSKVA